jgi:hypothetical protein
MSCIKQKVVFDAGIAQPKDCFEINDQSGRLTSVPKSPYAITETTNLVFTYNMGILGGLRDKNLNIGDGDVRPGHSR